MNEDIIVVTWSRGRALHADICHTNEQARQTSFLRMAEHNENVEVVIYSIVHHEKPNDHQFIAQDWLTFELS